MWVGAGGWFCCSGASSWATIPRVRCRCAEGRSDLGLLHIFSTMNGDSAGGPGLPLCPVSSTPDVLCPLASGPLQGLVSLSLPEKPEDRPSWGQVWAPEGRE